MTGSVATELTDAKRLLLEDVCSDIARFHHSGGDPGRLGTVRVDREVALPGGAGYADLRVEPDDGPPYFVEVKYGYDAPTLVAHLRRKYAALAEGAAGKIVVVADSAAYADWPGVLAALRAVLPDWLPIEVWDEARLRELTGACFGEPIPSLATTDLLAVRAAIDAGKDRLAFGAAPAVGYAETVLRQNLLWHFGTWRLRELRHARHGAGTGQLVPPGLYEDAVVLLADLSGFSRWVRDTPDAAVVRQSLTSFYAKSRYQVINAGGMLDQFVGDQVVALFGLPDRRPGYVADAVRTAIRLLDIGHSVSDQWQRRIDHVQTRRGVHIGMAMGRVQLVAMRPFDHARLSLVGESVNIAARLLALASPGEIIVSNVLRHALQGSAYHFVERDPIEAHNVGTIRPWQLETTDVGG